jgi:hypothetical protein
MQKMNCVYLLLPLLTSVGLMGAAARGAELDGAIQYPPPSVGADAQPPPPARMVPQTVSPRRIELGFDGSSLPPSTGRFLVHPPIRSGEPGAPPPTNGGD